MIINPILKYFDEPLNLVNLPDSKPPVHDSATDIDVFFLLIFCVILKYPLKFETYKIYY